jgi:hypothetical protein
MTAYRSIPMPESIGTYLSRKTLQRSSYAQRYRFVTTVSIVTCATLRPHQGLDGTTPTEIYFGLTPATAASVSQPIANSRDPGKPPALPFDVVRLAPGRRLPFPDLQEAGSLN